MVTVGSDESRPCKASSALLRLASSVGVGAVTGVSAGFGWSSIKFLMSP